MNNLTLIYDPSCSSVKDIESKVRQHDTGLGFVFGGHIYHKQGDRVMSQLITTSAMTRCFNRNNNDQIENNIHSLICMFRSTLQDIADYQLEVTSTNQTLTVPLHLSRIHMFSVSNRANTNNYFDLCLYTRGGFDDHYNCLCYSNKSVRGFTHSGDINSSERGLLHNISVSTSGRPFYLSVVGYNNTPLHKFSSQTPTVCIVNHDTRTVYIVPCPLDIMSMGEKGVFAILAKGNLEHDALQLTILPRPIVRERVNTGAANSITQNAIDEAANTNIVEITPSSQRDTSEDEFTMDFNEIDTTNGDGDNGYNGECNGEPVVIVQDKYNVPSELSHLDRYYFGSTISQVDEMSEVVLPIAGGSAVIGDNVLVHAKNPKVQNYAALLKASRCVVIVVGEEMQNSLIDKCQSKVNAVFIVVPAVQTGDVVDIMDSMCINAVTAMAGPCSVVLAHIRDEYYFYRGVSWPEFVENAAYGNNVTDSMHRLHYINTSSYPWPFVADMNEVYLKSNKIPLSDIENISFSETELPAFKDLVYQLQIIMSPEKLKLIQTIILNIITRKEQKLRQSPEVKQMIEEGRFKEIKKYIKTQRAAYVDIASLIENTISLQKSSSKKHDVHRLLRRKLIAANVEAAAGKHMGDMVDELCTELGTISCLINNGLLQSLLTYLKDGTVANWLRRQDDKYLTNVTNTCSRMNVLDGTTTSALLDNDQDNSYVCPDMSIRNIYDDVTYESIMFLPLHDKTYEDPYAVSWPIEANDRKVALLRIKMRSIIAEAVEHGFSPANKEINYVIIYLYFCILEKLTAGVTPNNDEDSTVRNIARAIISSILCAASSGQQPLPLYQIVSYNASITVPDNSFWWMYFKLRTLWKYTGWDQEIIDKKFKRFIVKCIRKHIVDPVTSKLRQSNKQRELMRKRALLTKKNLELEWLRTNIPLIQAGEMPHPYKDDVTTRGGTIIAKYLQGGPGQPNREYVLRVCEAIVLKRSRNNWKIPVPPEAEQEAVDKRLNIRNLPEMDQFSMTTAVFRNVVRTLYENHMNIEKSEELAVALLQ